MPVMIELTSAAHGGKSVCGSGSCGTESGHGNCGTDCTCGCPYSGMEEKGKVELIADIERSFPNEWLGLVIPSSEDEFCPERALLVVHSLYDAEVWTAVKRITHNQIVHVYFNGTMEHYEDWMRRSPPDQHVPRRPVMPVIPLLS